MYKKTDCLKILIFQTRKSKLIIFQYKPFCKPLFEYGNSKLFITIIRIKLVRTTGNHPLIFLLIKKYILVCFVINHTPHRSELSSSVLRFAFVLYLHANYSNPHLIISIGKILLIKHKQLKCHVLNMHISRSCQNVFACFEISNIVVSNINIIA